jgi:hypothetical protein
MYGSLSWSSKKAHPPSTKHNGGRVISIFGRSHSLDINISVFLTILPLFLPFFLILYHLTISNKGGTSRGDCALGFGVCCICKLFTLFSLFANFQALNFVCVVETTCNEEIHNNITYFVSPKFPAIMPSDKEHCGIKIKLVSEDISQIRLDFVHFSLVSDATPLN